MWEQTGFCAGLSVSAALLASPACGTEQVAPPAQAYVATTAGPDLGAFIVTFAPGASTYEEGQAWGKQARPDPPANLVFAPLYISAEGSFLAVFE